jgi:PAS domain S-box-containing protein
MKDTSRSNEQLIQEIQSLRQELANLKSTQSIQEHKSFEDDNLEKFKALVENTSDYVFFVDKNYVITAVNHTSAVMMGKEKQDIVGKTISELFPMTLSRIYTKGIEEVFKTGSIIVRDSLLQINNENININTTLNPILDENSKVIEVIGISRDISERKKAENELIQQKKKLDEAQKLAKVGNWELDLLKNTLTWSNEVYEIFEMTPDDFGATYESFLGVIHPDDREFVNKAYTDSLKNKTEYNIIHRLLLNNGKMKYVNERCKTFYNNLDEATRSIGTIQDITDRELIQQELIESEERYQLLSEATFEAIFISDKGICTGQNKTAEMMFGYTLEEAVGKAGTDWIIHKDRENVMQNMMAGYAGAYEVTALRKDGSVFPCEIQGRMMDYKGKKVRMTALRNISRRKKAEDELFEKKDELKKLSSLTFEGILIHNNGIAVDLNESLARMFGYKRSEILNKNIIQLCVPKKYHKLIFSKISQDKVEPYEVEGIKKDGTVFPIEIEASSIAEKDVSNRIAAIRNITKRKEAETAKHQSEEKYRLISEYTDDLVTLISFKANPKYIYASPSHFRKLGYNEDEIVGKSAFEFIHPEDKVRLIPLLKKYLSIKFNKFLGRDITEFTELLEFRIRDKEGNWHYIESTVNIINDDTVLFLSRDVTERKKIENELYKLSTAVQQSPAVIAVTDLKGKLEYVNPKFTEVTGYDFNDIKGINPRILKSGEQSDEIYRDLWKTISSGKIWRGEFHNKKKNGELFWEAASISPIFDKNKKTINYLKVAEDITERKLGQEALQKSEKRLKDAQQLARIGNYEVDFKTNSVFWSDELLRIYGFDPKKTSNTMSIADSFANVHPEDNKWLREEIDSAISSGKEISLVYRIIKQNGDVRYLNGSQEPVFNELGELCRISGTAQDITEKKEAELKLLKSEEKYRSLVESIDEGLAIVDENENMIFVNSASERIFGYKKENLIQMNLKDLITERDYCKVLEQTKNRQKGQSDSYELTIVKKDGSEAIISITSSPVFSVDHKYEGAFGIFSDITERKKTEEQIKLDLEEKSTLLRELYHRTKNNMQVISAMLSMQARTSESEIVKTTFKEIIHKIKTMSLVHQKLYEAHDLSNISLKSYIEDLVNMLVQSYRTQSLNININLELEDANVLIDTAIPLGLVLNEMISNIFKHAFPNNEKGEVLLRTFLDNNNEINLILEDNGIGSTKNIDAESVKSMGLHTIFGVVEHQIMGKISLETKAGFKWHITLKKDVHKKRI